MKDKQFNFLSLSISGQVASPYLTGRYSTKSVQSTYS